MGRPRKQAPPPPRLAVAPPRGLGPPPRRFEDDDDAREAWEWFASQVEQDAALVDADREAIELYCRSKSRYLKAEQALEEFGLTVTGQMGEKANPHLAISKASQAQMVALLVQLGMTPKSRSSPRGGKGKQDLLTAFIVAKPSHAPKAKA